MSIQILKICYFLGCLLKCRSIQMQTWGMLSWWLRGDVAQRHLFPPQQQPFHYSVASASHKRAFVRVKSSSLISSSFRVFEICQNCVFSIWRPLPEAARPAGRVSSALSPLWLALPFSWNYFYSCTTNQRNYSLSAFYEGRHYTNNLWMWHLLSFHGNELCRARFLQVF